MGGERCLSFLRSWSDLHGGEGVRTGRVVANGRRQGCGSMEMLLTSGGMWTLRDMDIRETEMHPHLPQPMTLMIFACDSPQDDRPS